MTSEKMKYLIYFSCLLALGSCQISYKMCVFPNDYAKCDSLNRGNVGCEKVQDSVDCALKILNNKADFGIFYPEQSFLVKKFINEQTGIIGEIRAKERQSQKNSFQMVVVVRQGYTGGLDGLKNKRYCHPGFEHNELWTPRLRKELEYFLFKDKLRQNCEAKENVALLEKEIQFLSEYFGDSCRAGRWTRDETLDKQLKTKYAKLCKLCDSNCNYDGNSPQKSALKCLTERNGDFAYTTFEALSSLQNVNNYKLLCKNGDLADITRNVTDICSWRNQPWSFIIGKKEKVGNIQNSLREWINPDLMAVTVGASPFLVTGRKIGSDIHKTLETILTDGETQKLNIFTESVSLDTFLQREGHNLGTEFYSDCPMRWCVISDKEKQKCDWLSEANSIAGIEPKMSCIVSQNIYECLTKIQNNNADIMSIDSNYGYLARKLSLHNVLYNENSEGDISSIVAVLPSSSEITSFKDLKEKKACFPEYRGLAWLSFIETARKRKLIPDNCDFTKSVQEFFSSACTPGATDNYHFQSQGADNSKLCSLCSTDCTADLNNGFYDNEGALKCLRYQNADVAFVEKQIFGKLPADADYDKNNYKILCSSDSTKNIDDVDEECVLSETIDSEIIARLNDTRKTDYKLALLQMDKLFGVDYKNEQTMQMFKIFDDTIDLMFKSTVLGFDDDSSDNKYVQNYMELFNKVNKCTGGAWSMNASNIVLFISFMLITILVRNA